MKPSASVKSALGGKIGKPNRPSPMSVGSGGATPGTQDMLSRPKRTRRKGYKKTSERPGKDPAGKLPDLGALLALPQLGGPGGGMPPLM